MDNQKSKHDTVKKHPVNPDSDKCKIAVTL
jgi:hypothetical protein